MIKKIVTKAKFAEAKLKDGTMIATPDAEWVVGSRVYIVAEDGTQVDAPTGDYELEDGTIVKVVDWYVTEIVAPVEETKEVEAELSTEEVFELTEDEIAKLATSLQPMFDAINTKIANIEKANVEMAKQNATLFAENKALKESMSKIPGVAITKTVKTEDKVAAKPYEKMTPDEKAKAFEARFSAKK